MNCEKRKERHDELQAVISPSILHQILISTPPWMRKWKRKRMESRETRGSVSRQVNLIEIHLKDIQPWRTSLFKGRHFVTIRSLDERLWWNGSSRTVSVKSRSSDRQWTARWTLDRVRYKTHQSSSFRSRSNGWDAIRADASRLL